MQVKLYNRSLPYIIACLILMTIGLLNFKTVTKLDQSSKMPQNTSDKVYIGARIIDTALLNNQTDYNFTCVQTRLLNNSFPVCTYTRSQDRLVSGAFLSGRYPNDRDVQNIVDWLRRDDRLVFVDLGANLGAFTLPVAHTKRRVIAVEPNADTNSRLARSIAMGNVSGYVTLLLNAVSNEHVTLSLGLDQDNRANTYLLNSSNCSQGTNRRCTSNSVDTITMDDLLPLMTSDRAIIKIDIQGSEIKAFHPKTSSKFFDNIEVPFIRMEWHFYTQSHYQDYDGRKKIRDWLTFFRKRNYTAYDPLGETRLSGAWHLWPSDVIFQKYF